MNNNVDWIIRSALCSACGACAGICPKDAIRMTENTAGFLCADIDEDKCVDCGICLKVCPSNPVSEPREEKEEDALTGEILGCYVGYACDPKIRLQSQSGGVVTALLLYLLEQGQIDAAITNRFDPQKRRSYAAPSATREELLASCGSYYTQSAVVQTVLDHRDKRLAAVILGCQGEAIQRVRARLKNQELPAYTIGLFCAQQNSARLYDELIAQTECDLANEQLLSFRFRSKERSMWPGSIHFRTDACRYDLPKGKRIELADYYRAFRCAACRNLLNVHCDVACGDPYGVRLPDKRNGYTVMIARTEKGLQLLNAAAEHGYINMKPAKTGEVLGGQGIANKLRPRVLAMQSVYRQKGWTYPYAEYIRGRQPSDAQLASAAKQAERAKAVYLCQSESELTQTLDTLRASRKTGGKKRRSPYRKLRSMLRRMLK